MSNYQFSLAERWAVFQTHGTPQGTTCWLCYEPLNFLDMQVDHILPEWLGNDDRTALFAGVKTDFGLPSSFDLNDYGNWLPSHPRCNNKKSQTVFRSTPIILVWLQQASERADKARSAEGEEKTKRRTDNAIGVLVTANSEVRAKALHELGSWVRRSQLGSRGVKLTLRPTIERSTQSHRLHHLRHEPVG